jgi:hypothetical protein
MTTPFEDTFDRPDGGDSTLALPGDATADAAKAVEAGRLVGAEAGTTTSEEGGLGPFLDGGIPDGGDTRPRVPSNLGPNWMPARTNAWRVENGKLCGEGAHNHGVWLNRTLPVNARIEYDATAYNDDGDLKSEVWGDGHSYATGTSYTNATSYLVILGGWKNSIHAIARINEHGNDRKEIKVDKESDDPRQRPVVKGQVYQTKIERTDGKTVRWTVNGVEMMTFVDPAPLAGQGHDHFGFNEWEAKVCFDNVKVTPL